MCAGHSAVYRSQPAASAHQPEAAIQALFPVGAGDWENRRIRGPAGGAGAGTACQHPLAQQSQDVTVLLFLSDLGQHRLLHIQQRHYFVIQKEGRLRFFKGGEASQ